MDMYGGGWTLTTRISAKHQQHGTYKGRWNVGDLKEATTKAPTRAAKMSDADINTVAGNGGIRWVIVANKGTFFKYKKAWRSASGSNRCCSCSAPDFYSGYSTPSNNPSWSSGGSHKGSCGGSHSSNGGWTVLSGINTNDNTYFGGYTGSSAFRATAPAKYVTANVGNGNWHQPGLVFEKAASSTISSSAKCSSCPAGYFNDGKQKLVAGNKYNGIVMESATGGGCTKCPEGTMSYGGAKVCNRVVSTKEMDAATKLIEANTASIASNTASIASLETKMKEDVDTLLQGTLQTMQAQLADVKDQAAAQKKAFDAEIALVKGDLAAQEAAVDAEIAAVVASVSAALAKGTANVALPPAKSSAQTACGGAVDPGACGAFSESDCAAPITGGSVSAECPVLCNSCKSRENGPAIATKAGTISISLHDGDHVRIGDDFLLTAEEVQQLIQDGVAEAFENVKNAM